MLKALACFAAVVPFTVLLAGCHPPDREIYEKTKTCIGVFNAGLSVVPSARFRQAGVDRFDVDKAAAGRFDDAIDSGRRAGLDSKTIVREVDAAKAAARTAYADAAAPGQERKLAALVDAVKRCLPNDDFSGNQ